MASFKIGRSMLRQLLSATISFIAERTKSGKGKERGSWIRRLPTNVAGFAEEAVTALRPIAVKMYIAQLPPMIVIKILLQESC